MGSHLLEIAQDKFIKLKKGENKIEKEKLKSFYEEELREKEDFALELESPPELELTLGLGLDLTIKLYL